MAIKFRNKYRIPSTRLPGWDYANNAYYFITICTAHRYNFFGDVKHRQMQLSNCGMIARECWINLKTHFPFIILDKYVVMPNHVHGIIIINQHNIDNNYCRDVACYVSTPPPTENNAQMSAISPKTATLSTIVRSFKSAVTKQINNADPNKKIIVWQTRFHDHIIRDERAYHTIRQYIQNNPANWEKDKFHKNQPALDFCPIL